MSGMPPDRKDAENSMAIALDERTCRDERIARRRLSEVMGDPPDEKPPVAAAAAQLTAIVVV